MKIIGRPYRRRHPHLAAEYTPPVVSQPKRKALLIGINYAQRPQQNGNDRSERSMELQGPHRDVMAMRQLLIDTYGYKTDYITLMKDDGENKQLEPTRANILREIVNLVRDAQAGDRFFFHYAGHTTQKVNTHNSEDDGMDECLVPCDDQHAHPVIITDNELRRLLVDSLPVGSNLVAVFDSCHSASLLDLDHQRCNRVYVPWISKGKRRSDSLWNRRVRQQAMISSRRVYQSRRVSPQRVRSRKTSIDQVKSIDQVLNSSVKRLSITTKSLEMKSDFVSWLDCSSSPIQRCDSPVSLFPCDGFCKPSNTNDTASVISVSACKDDQISWEDDDGGSMTSALIEILKGDPHPTLKDMMMNISHRLHALSRNVHHANRDYKKKLKKWEKETGRKVPSEGLSLDTDNFMDPQLSSHKPLDLNSRWNL